MLLLTIQDWYLHYLALSHWLTQYSNCPTFTNSVANHIYFKETETRYWKDTPFSLFLQQNQNIIARIQLRELSLIEITELTCHYLTISFIYPSHSEFVILSLRKKFEHSKLRSSPRKFNSCHTFPEWGEALQASIISNKLETMWERFISRVKSLKDPSFLEKSRPWWKKALTSVTEAALMTTALPAH